jgi:hypothetical protein
MSVLNSISLSIFCTPDEFSNWLRQLCAEENLSCAQFRDSASFATIFETAEEIVISPDTHRMFLYPPSFPPASRLTMNDVRSREWGWVDIRPGHLVDAKPSPILTLSEVGAEDFAHEPIRPSRYVRRLKRAIREEVVKGLVGRSVLTSAASAYRNIVYSMDALALYNSGVVWKQFIDGNVIFEPAQSLRNGNTYARRLR